MKHLSVGVETRVIPQNAVYLIYNEEARSVDYKFSWENNILKGEY
jgi:hypothetical protein